MSLTSLSFCDCGVLAGRDRRGGFVGLAGGAVVGHDPVVGVVLVLGGEEDGVALADKVEEVFATLEICENCEMNVTQSVEMRLCHILYGRV